MKILVTKTFPILWFVVIATVCAAILGLQIVEASEHDCRCDCEPEAPAVQADASADPTAESVSFATSQVAQEDFEAAKEAAQEQHEETEYRVNQQQSKIDSLEQSETALREELKRLQDEADAREAEREEKRKALAESLSKYKVQRVE